MEQSLAAAALDLLDDGIALFDAEDRLIYCNSVFRGLYHALDGVTLEGMTFAQLLTRLLESGEIAGKLAAARPEEWLRLRMAEHRGCMGAAEQQLADGRWLRLVERPLPGGGVMARWSDVTAAKRAAFQLEDIREATADGFALWDQAGRLVRCNSRFAAHFEGLDGPPQPGWSYRKVLENLAAAGRLVLSMPDADWIVRRQAQRRIPVSEEIIDFADGRHVMLRERRTRDGGSAMVLTDVTQLKRHEQELLRKSESLEQAVSQLQMGRLALEKQGETLVRMAEEIVIARDKAEASSEQLRESEARLRVITANVPGVIYQWALRSDGSRRFSYVSEKSLEIFGIPAADLMRDPELFAIHPDDRDRWAESIAQALMESRDWSFEGRVILPNGDLRWWRGVASPLLSGSEELLLNGVIVDITRQKQLEQDLRILATTDPLTGALNRRAFMDGMRQAAARFERGQGVFAVLISDIDHFKKINDAHGHGIGDEALKAFVTAAKASLRTVDVLGRMGGEEFAVILAGDDAKRAREASERLREAIGAIRVPLPDGGMLSFTVSIGVTAWRHGDSPDSALARADEALYKAKESGRNRVILAEAEQSAAP